jgi:sterol desaturase/sphingolipid hydroxylase (fatty acid hydroxylase superfamily)
MEGLMPIWMLNSFRLKKREYYADFVITPLMTLVVAFYSLADGLSQRWLGEFALGWMAWTLYEYLVHRFVLHEMALFREVHGLHHANQLEYVALHPLATLAIYLGFVLAFGVGSSPIMVGFSLGYIYYSAVHTSYHYLRINASSWWYKGDQRHVLHHRYGNVCYGVSTGAWDRLFRTERA